MSELKAINAYQLTTNTEYSDVYIHNDEFGCGGDLVECYLKSEADKVIAELERDIVKLKSSLKYLVVRGLIDGPVKKAVEDLLKEVEDAH